jgi:hypothetical protein
MLTRDGPEHDGSGREDKMDARTSSPSHPTRKISETFLHFAAQMLQDPSIEASAPRIEEALRVAFTAWNAVVFADVLKDHRFLDEIRGRAAETPGVVALMEELIARKRALFGDDERLIGTWEVSWTSGGFSLRADARDPHSLPRAPG